MPAATAPIPDAPRQERGASLRARREAMGLTRVQLGAALGVDHTTIYYWETGKRPLPRRLVDLAMDAIDDATGPAAQAARASLAESEQRRR